MRRAQAKIHHHIASQVPAYSQFQLYPFHTALLIRAAMLLRVMLDPIRNERLIRVTVPDFAHSIATESKNKLNSLSPFGPSPHGQ
jgi:hypothetical protein